MLNPAPRVAMSGEPVLDNAREFERGRTAVFRGGDARKRQLSDAVDVKKEAAMNVEGSEGGCRQSETDSIPGAVTVVEVTGSA